MGGRKVLYRLFDTLYDGCPQLDFFNTFDLRLLRQHQLTKKQWSYHALKICVKKCKKKYEQEFGRGRDTQEER
jgi:hypothetical protein